MQTYHDKRSLPSNPPPENSAPPDWNPGRIQTLIDDAYKRGETPVVLCLGRNEAAALKVYLSKFFDDEAICLKNLVYAGLKIVELRVDSHLRVETLRSIYRKSRHAEQSKIRRAMERSRITASIPIHSARPQPK